MAKNRKRRKGTKQNLKALVCPTHEFVHESPSDPDTDIVFHVRRLTPGHMMSLKDTTLMRLYQVAQPTQPTQDTQVDVDPDADVDPEVDAARKEAEAKDEIASIIENYDVLVSVNALAIVDEKTGQPYLTEEDCRDLLLAEWMRIHSEYALQGAVPSTEGGEENEIDTFPEETNGHEEPEPPKDSE